MTTPPPAPALWPGTDPKTGWPVSPKHPCYKGVLVCHLRLTGGPMECGYEPARCPFYGRWPDVNQN